MYYYCYVTRQSNITRLLQLCTIFVDLPRKDVESLIGKISPIYRQSKMKPSSFLLESHISANTFLENKRGIHQQAAPQQSWTVRFIQQHSRGFKTHRSDINHQNPSVTERLRNKLLAMDNKRVALGSIHDGSNIKGVFNSENLGHEEQSRLKVLSDHCS